MLKKLKLLEKIWGPDFGGIYKIKSGSLRTENMFKTNVDFVREYSYTAQNESHMAGCTCVESL